LPEKENDFNELLDQIRRFVIRRRWWIMLPASSIALAVIALLWTLPNRYRSEATLLVVEQQVPERYVTPNSQVDIGAALEAMKQEVLSRTRLLRIIEEFDLYAEQREFYAPEEVMELMLRDINILPLITGSVRRQDYNAFKISFITEDPHLAQQVTRNLTSLFIEENLRAREEQSVNTTKFLRDQLAIAEQKLLDQEQRLRDFKMRNLGELPEQEQGNLRILAGLHDQLQDTMARMSRAQERRVYLESLIGGYRDLARRGVPVPGTPAAGRMLSPLEAAEADLARLQSEKTALSNRYSELHPSLVKIERDLEDAEALVERLRAEAPATETAESQQPSSGAPQDDPAVAQVISQLEANRLELENIANDEAQLKASIAQYQSRLNQTPIREQQLARIVRDYDSLKKEYDDLLSKEMESQLATNLERRQGGQQFRLVDPPSLPEVPVSPKRLKLSLAGIAGGGLIGLVLAFLVEVRKSSFHTEKELRERFELPVLSVPVLLTPAEEQQKTWKGVLEWLAVGGLALVVLVAEFYVYRYG